MMDTTVKSNHACKDARTLYSFQHKFDLNGADFI